MWIGYCPLWSSVGYQGVYRSLSAVMAAAGRPNARNGIFLVYLSFSSQYRYPMTDSDTVPRVGGRVRTAILSSWGGCNDSDRASLA